jgi:hypothetical protein
MNHIRAEAHTIHKLTPTRDTHTKPTLTIKVHQALGRFGRRGVNHQTPHTHTAFICRSTALLFVNCERNTLSKYVHTLSAPLRSAADLQRRTQRTKDARKATPFLLSSSGETVAAAVLPSCTTPVLCFLPCTSSASLVYLSLRLTHTHTHRHTSTEEKQKQMKTLRRCRDSRNNVLRSGVQAA